MLKENEDMFEDWNLSEFKKILSLLKDWTSEKKYNTPGAHLEVKDKEGGNKTDSDFTEKSKSQKNYPHNLLMASADGGGPRMEAEGERRKHTIPTKETFQTTNSRQPKHPATRPFPF